MLFALGARALLVHLVRTRADIPLSTGRRIYFLRPILALLVPDEPIAQPLFPEIPLLVRNPIVQTPMRADDEFTHGDPLNEGPHDQPDDAHTQPLHRECAFYGVLTTLRKLRSAAP
jgi:hypothetical protein